MSRLVMGFSVLDIICMSGSTMDGMLVEVDGLDVVLVIEMVVKLMMSLVVDDVVVSLMLVSRVVVNRLAMDVVVDMALFLIVLRISIESTMDGVFVEVDWLDVVLVIKMMVELVMSLVVDYVVVSLMLVGRVVVSRLAVSD